MGLAYGGAPPETGVHSQNVLKRPSYVVTRSTLIEGRGLVLSTFVGLGVGALEHALVAVRDWLVDALTALAARAERVHDVAEVGPVGDLR